MKTTAEEILKKKVDELSQHSHYQPYKYWDSTINAAIIEAMEEFASLKEDKWISVETPPEKAGSFIVSINGKSKEAFFSFGFKRWYVKSTAPLEVEDMEINPTHWQPLPSPPKTEK